ncbi:MAG: hypothetical protein UU14_C0016G0004 [Candidatus Roizmanbacteria bacterium GW2011_GWB1_40_7]|uniref:Uncharacterized protein n=2 Tax=Candidatus Roizmaniibacteriota TaxID=1752723 RepID=A0A0G0T4E8_9BACT|nr:MAG: hypothetical protein UU14_C0016G0004 [Candidatus Roizmanbacteria bacterium GW2011_GWB1_40_7]KKR93911.1 MAG: hypothetical protein UU41_C0017G0004 [Candidatus Roizmanbacteria bacterium GW2011_GWA1_41_13]
MPANPVYRSREAKLPITLFHTHHVTKALIIQIIRERKSIELDISHNRNSCYIGHHTSFYTDNQKPNNICLHEAIESLKTERVFVKFDCKTPAAIPTVKSLIRQVGPDRSMIHGFVKELEFSPYPKEVHHSFHWQTESIKLYDLLRLKKETGNPPLQVSCRGLTEKRLHLEGIDVAERIESVLPTDVDVVNLNIHIPRNTVPPEWIMQRLYDRKKLLTEVYVDHVKDTPLPVPYFGTTNDLGSATVLYTSN